MPPDDPVRVDNGIPSPQGKAHAHQGTWAAVPAPWRVQGLPTKFFHLATPPAGLAIFPRGGGRLAFAMPHSADARPPL